MIKKQTPVIRSTNKPQWNCKLEFHFRYPPLVRLCKIELCAVDPSGERVLSTEYLAINDISNFLNDVQYLPTYGPRYVDLYNEPNNKRIKRTFSSGTGDDDFSNSGSANNSNSHSSSRSSHDTYLPLVAKGAFYVARLYMSIYSMSAARPSSVLKESLQTNNSLSQELMINPREKRFVAFAIINEVTMIDSRYLNGELSFQLCIGSYNIRIFSIK